MDAQAPTPAPPNVYDVLEALGIAFRRHDHAPVYTCDEAERAVPSDGKAVHTKNLFLRDKKGARHWLVVTSCAKAVDVAQLALRIGADRLSFASPERLATHLQVTPGAVSLLALLADRRHEVSLVIDAAVWRCDALCCHPLVNTATLVLARHDVERFLAFTGHSAQITEIPQRV